VKAENKERADSAHPPLTMGNMASNTVNQMAFCPPPPTYRKQDVNMWLETDKGNRIPAFHIRRGHPITILVSHANAEDLGIVLGFWTYMSDALQVDVFAYEYSGYGHSTGTPSEENMYSDARAALQLLVDGFKLKPERDIILYGKSIGSCPTCHLASRARVRGVMIVSGLASGSRVLFPTTKVYLMDMLYFHNIGRLASNKSPVQVVHGTHDEVIPFSNGQDLHAASGKNHPLPPAWIDGATHNNLETVHSVAYMRAFRAFIKHLLATAPNEAPAKSGGWFDWIPGVPNGSKSPTTPTVKVEGTPRNAADGGKNGPTTEPMPNPWAKQSNGSSSNSS
jgi:pimeloyl-ACP methyl ester carboxylesterase